MARPTASPRCGVNGGRLLLGAAAAAIALVIVPVLSGDPAERPERETASRVLQDAPKSQSARSMSWSGGAVVASTGETVVIYVSTGLPPEAGTPSSWAEFLAGLVQGSELASLRSYVATLDEVGQLCGPSALGCYGGDELISIGTTVQGITAAEVVRHEYGHHVALHRVNAPWLAIAWGPKHWASNQNVCLRAAQGTVFPGDEGANYRLNPGEAWAETYRVLDEQRSGATGSGWSLVDPSFVPGATTLVAAERDVLQPWAANTTTVYRNRFTAARRTPWVIRLDLPLDGDLRITASLPKGGMHDVTLLSSDRKTVVSRGLWAGTTVKRISTSVCGVRTLYLRVTQRGALGRVAVVVSRP